MARTTDAGVEPTTQGTADESRPARDIKVTAGVKMGLIGGLTAVFISANGMVAAFAERAIVTDVVTLGYVFLLSVPFVVAFVGSKPPEELEGVAASRRSGRNVAVGALAGALTGSVLWLFAALVSAVDIRATFPNVSPRMLELITFGRGLGAALAVLVVSSAVLGAAAGALHLLAARWRRATIAGFLWVFTMGLLQVLIAQMFIGAKVGFVAGLLYERAGLSWAGGAAVFALVFAAEGFLADRRRDARRRFDALPAERRRAVGIVAAVAGLLFVAVLPQILGQFLSEVLNVAGIFLLMALGLNIVVGFAGLLDLGYVAFFAVGAYSAAILTSAGSPRWSPELVFWAALPVVVLAAAIAGVLVGTPVLRMRGDYLAIVTLGFGEIARILLLSSWLTPTFGGAQGILRIPDLSVGPIVFRSPQTFVYAIVVFGLIAAYISWSLRESRIGRAWMAMREDEPVAEAMGVNIVRAKLQAFIVGAILASFAGALFSMKIGSVFPHSFDIIVSITVLVIVIVGGMGSIPGVAVGALLLMALPELLREFEEFKFLLYGALLIYMMLKRPEGLIPSKQRAAELHQEEVMQDAWIKGNVDQAERGPAPA